MGRVFDPDLYEDPRDVAADLFDVEQAFAHWGDPVHKPRDVPAMTDDEFGAYRSEAARARGETTIPWDVGEWWDPLTGVIRRD